MGEGDERRARQHRHDGIAAPTRARALGGSGCHQVAHGGEHERRHQRQHVLWQLGLVEREEDERDDDPAGEQQRSEEHTSELQSRSDLVCRLLLEKKKKKETMESFQKNASVSWKAYAKSDSSNGALTRSTSAATPCA